MANSHSLQGLRDIHLPEAIGWLPMAPGWYLLIALSLSACVLACFYVALRRRQGLPRREALRMLDACIQDYEKGQAGTQQSTAEVNELLRRVALAYYPRAKVAALSGKAWIDFLSSSAKKVDFHTIAFMLLELPYQPDQQINIKPLFIRTKLWIQQRRKPCLA